MEANDIAPDETQEPVQELLPARKSSRKRNITIFVIVSVLNAALLVLLWTQLLTPATKPTGTSFGSSAGLGDIDSPLLGKPAPDFTLPTLNGGPTKIHLADFKGKPVVLNFWASWCGPCNEEAPFLQKTWPQLHSQGVVLIGIDGDVGLNSSTAALNFMKKYGVTYVNAKDDANGSTAISYGATGFPETVFINRDGVVVAKWIKPLDTKGLQLELAKMKL